MATNDYYALLSRIIAKAWRDTRFRRRLVRSPREALADAGITVLAGTRIKVLEDTTELVHIVIPLKPTAARAIGLGPTRTIPQRTIMRTISRTIPRTLIRTIAPRRKKRGQ